MPRLHPYPNPQEDPQYYDPGIPRSEAERSARGADFGRQLRTAAELTALGLSGFEIAPILAAGARGLQAAIRPAAAAAGSVTSRLQGRSALRAPQARPQAAVPRGVQVSPRDLESTERNVQSMLERSAQGRGREAAPPARSNWRAQWEEERDFFREYLRGTIQKNKDMGLGDEDDLVSHLAEWEKPMDLPLDEDGWRRMYLMQKRANDNLKRLGDELGKIREQGAQGLNKLEGELGKMKAPSGGQGTMSPEDTARLQRMRSTARRPARSSDMGPEVPPPGSAAWKQFEGEMTRQLAKAPRKPYQAPKVLGEGKKKDSPPNKEKP